MVSLCNVHDASFASFMTAAIRHLGGRVVSVSAHLKGFDERLRPVKDYATLDRNHRVPFGLLASHHAIHSHRTERQPIGLTTTPRQRHRTTLNRG